MADKQKQEPEMTTSQALNEMTRVSNTYRAAEHLKEALVVVTNLDGRKAVLDEEIKALELQKKDVEKELANLRSAVELARSQSKSDLAKLDAALEAKRKSTDADLAAMDKEYEEARERANVTLSQQFQDGRAQVDEWKAKLGDVQRQVHRLEAEITLKEQRKAQA